MTQVMKGVRVIEVAQFVMAPSAGALLADWGADVIKIEHPIYGDAQRGFVRWSGTAFEAGRNPVFEGPNRGKRSSARPPSVTKAPIAIAAVSTVRLSGRIAASLMP
jgi:crotonobetainyl-CoA:carnitine CoA-transferase CaiB-like acyl-CoA transferase